MEILNKIPFEIDLAKLLETVHIEAGTEDAAAIAALAARAAEVARPVAICGVAYIEERDDEGVVFGGVRFESRILRENLEEVERVFPFVASCGPELDRVDIPAGDPLADYWLDSIKLMALSAASGFLIDHLKERHSVAHLSSMSPGAGPADMWPIEQQRPLFSLLGDTEGAIGVRLTESCLMLPNKSRSGIYFPKESSIEACAICPRENCPGRRAKYDAAQAEGLR